MKKTHFSKAEKKVPLLYFKNNLIGGSPEVKIGIFFRKNGKIFNPKYHHFWAKWVITRDYPALHRSFWHLELRYSIINRFRHGGGCGLNSYNTKYSIKRMPFQRKVSDLAILAHFG